MKITIEEARRFILLKQGLLGNYKFTGKQGALDYVRQAGCIQFDPVDDVRRRIDNFLIMRYNIMNK